MLNISGLTEGIVLDHIQAGKSMDIYYKLGLEQLECQTAIIKNAKSSKMGKKDIIKIDGGLDDEKKETYRCQYCEEKYSK